MRNELVNIISRWDQSEPLVDHLLKNGVGVLCKNPKTNFEKLKAMSIEEMAKLYVDFIMTQKCVLGELERTSAVAIDAVSRDLFFQAVAWLKARCRENEFV